MLRSIHENMKAALCAISLAATCLCQAEEPKLSQVETALSSTVLSGYIDTSASIDFSHSANLPGGQSVPEPSSVALLSMGGAAVMLVLRRRMNRR